MPNADWIRIKEIFYQTLDLPESERGRFLAEQDDFVREEVAQLLASHEKARDFIAEPAMVEFGLNGKSLVGKTIGGYKILDIIGAGGMGTVFLAEKEGLEKRAALKVIKRGMDTDAVLRRFMLERRILSRLEHPNIARLLDGGMTDDGLPFFVMEYVEGLPLNRFCARRQCDTDQRLALFRQICAAVAYSHQNLVIHRDLKPSNILVTNDGTPKLLDFGIAKLLDAEDSENTATATQGRIFTPEYAAPEQLGGGAVTTASDVYSLGVILYELLCGQRPFQAKSRNYQEIVRAVLTEEPPAPSALTNDKLQITHEKIADNTSQDQRPKTKDQTNQKSLKGDLDNIILKALRKEPERRYQTVREFSEDIGRYLDGLPVSATADTRLYRFSKFIRRHRQGAIAGSFIGLLILAISGAAIWQAVVANRERAKAERRFEQVRKLANTVLFEYHDGIAKLPGATAMREKMVVDSLEFLDNLAGESGDSPDLQREIVKAYQKVGDVQGASDTGNVGKTQAALASYQKALDLQRKLVENNPENVEDRRTLGNLLIDTGLQQRNAGDWLAAEKSLENALETFSTLPVDVKKQNSLAKTFWNTAMLRTAQNDLDASLENYGKAVEIWEELAISDSANKLHKRNLALTNKNIGSVLQLRGESEKALAHFQKALAIDLENARNNPNDVSAQLDLSFTYGTLGGTLRGAGDFQNALANIRQAIEIRQRIFNADAQNAFAENALARGFQDLGQIFLAQAQYGAARGEFEKAQEIYRKISESDAASTMKKARVAENSALLGYAYGLSGIFGKASELYAASFGIYENLMGQGKLSALDQRRFVAAYTGFAEILLKNNQPVRALDNLQKARALLENEKVAKDAAAETANLNRLWEEANRKAAK